MPTNFVDTNPNNVWGKIVVYLKDNGFNALHVMCGAITDIGFVNEDFVVYVGDEFTFNYLTEKANANILNRAMTWQNLPYRVKIVLKEIEDETKKDLDILKTIVGEYLKIK